MARNKSEFERECERQAFKDKATNFLYIMLYVLLCIIEPFVPIVAAIAAIARRDGVSFAEVFNRLIERLGMLL